MIDLKKKITVSEACRWIVEVYANDRIDVNTGE